MICLVIHLFNDLLIIPKYSCIYASFYLFMYCFMHVSNYLFINFCTCVLINLYLYSLLTKRVCIYIYIYIYEYQFYVGIHMFHIVMLTDTFLTKFPFIKGLPKIECKHGLSTPKYKYYQLEKSEGQSSGDHTVNLWTGFSRVPARIP